MTTAKEPLTEGGYLEAFAHYGEQQTGRKREDYQPIPAIETTNEQLIVPNDPEIHHFSQHSPSDLPTRPPAVRQASTSEARNVADLLYGESVVQPMTDVKLEDEPDRPSLADASVTADIRPASVGVCSRTPNPCALFWRWRRRSQSPTVDAITGDSFRYDEANRALTMQQQVSPGVVPADGEPSGHTAAAYGTI